MVLKSRKKKNAILIVAAAVTLIMFVFLTVLICTDRISWLDDPIRYWLYDLRTESLTEIVVDITTTCNAFSVVILLLFLLVVFFTRWNFGVPVAVAEIVAILLNLLIKDIVGRERPGDVVQLVTETGPSFPSGHSCTSFVVFGFLIYISCFFMKKVWTKILVIIGGSIYIFLIAITRIYLGVHYPSDILGGWLEGCVILFPAFIFYPWYYDKVKRWREKVKKARKSEKSLTSETSETSEIMREK